MQQGRSIAISLHAYANAFKKHDLLGQLMRQAMVPSSTLQEAGQSCSEENGNAATIEPEEAGSPAGQARQNLLAQLLTAERVAALLRLMQQDLQHANLDALTRLQTRNSPDLPANAVAAAGLLLFCQVTVAEAEAPLAVVFVESSHCLDLLFECGGSQCDVISSIAIEVLMKLDALVGDGSPLHELWLEQLQQLQPHIMNAAIQQGSSLLAEVMIALGQQHAVFVAGWLKWLDPLLGCIDSGSSPCMNYLAKAVCMLAALPDGKQLLGANPDRAAVLARAFAGQEVTTWQQLHVDVSHYSALALRRAADDPSVQQVLSDPSLMSMLLNCKMSSRARYTEASLIAVLETVALVAGPHLSGAKAALSHLGSFLHLKEKFSMIYLFPLTVRASAAAAVAVLFQHPECVPELVSDRFVAGCIDLLAPHVEQDEAAAKAIAIAVAASPLGRQCIQGHAVKLLKAVFERLKQAAARSSSIDNEPGLGHLLAAVRRVMQDWLQGHSWDECLFMSGIMQHLLVGPRPQHTHAIIVHELVLPLVSCRTGRLLLYKHRQELLAAANRASEAGAVMCVTSGQEGYPGGAGAVGSAPLTEPAQAVSEPAVDVIRWIMGQGQAGHNALLGDLTKAELDIKLAIVQLAAFHKQRR
eukprot:gene13237-13367_t